MDALVALNHEERVSWAVPLAESHPEVTHAEAWYFNHAAMKLASGQAVRVLVEAGPDDTQFYQPNVVAGRWLLPDDDRAIVVNRKWADEEGVRIGDAVTLDLGPAHPESSWIVVGVNQDLVQQRTSVFVPFDSLDRVLQRTDRTATLELRYTAHDAQAQRRITADIVRLLDSRSAEVHSTQVLGEIKTQVTSQYRILVVFLLVMAGLTALVGGIGLMGMMSINVLERSKEIGVMRAIGADTTAILLIFWGESMVISLVSFLLAGLLSWPLARLMTWAVGMAFIHTPLNFAYAAYGLGLWLALVLLIGTLASIAPAFNAARLSVRESLSYE
jgi:putative ABC transport system permease protein